MSKTSACLAVVGVMLLACGSEPRGPKPPEVGEAFSTLPLPPDPEFVSRAGGAGALQITVRTPAKEAEVAELYRRMLSQDKWRLVSDVKNPDGVTAMYAEHDGPPLWVRIWPAGDRPGTMVQLTGAAIGKDSTKLPAVGDSSAKRPRT